ncbi:MAG: hypothetical protein AB7O32_09300 [Vicinamibacterales bacterium]
MPGLCLTLDLACRLWSVDPTTCGHVLQDLAAQGFVVATERGVYVRRTAA